MNDEEMETGRSGAMRDKEAEERIAMAAHAAERPVFMYRPGESRIFRNPESIPEGEGWVDSPALVRPPAETAPEAPPVAVSPLRLVPTPEIQTPAGEAPKRKSRK